MKKKSGEKLVKECKECGRKHKDEKCPVCGSKEHVWVSPPHNQFYSGMSDRRKREPL